MTVAIQEGDIVQLKSGGQLMTVEGFEMGAAICIWFNAAQDLNREKLSLAAIRKAPPASSVSVSGPVLV